jgi:hypothetical protein
LIGLMLVAAASITAVFWFRNRKRFSADYEKVVYLLEKKLKKRGYDRYKGESVSAFCRRVGFTESTLKNLLLQLSEETERALYANSQSDLTRLKHLIGKLKT